jgi:hypothetical protein
MNAFTRAIGWAYYNRVPLLTLAVIGALGPCGRSSSLLGNVVNVSGCTPREYFFVGFAAALACASAIVSMNLVNYYGPDRFGVNPYPTSIRARLVIFGLGAAPCGILLTTVWLATPDGYPALMALGVVAAACLIVAVKILELVFANAALRGGAMEYYVFPLDCIPGLNARLAAWYHDDPPFHGRLNLLFSQLRWPFLKALQHTPDGYLTANRTNFRPGHSFASFFLTVAFLFYFFAGGNSFIDSVYPWAGLIYILLYLTVAGWSLDAISFFLDRYRLPLIVPLVVFCLTAGYNSRSDHFYRIEKRSVAPFPTPAKVLRTRPTPILVATAGGGIQAAAWTAKVLGELSRNNPGFRNSLALISGASGGSVGAMCYLSNQEDPEKSISTAKKSSLEYVTWGLLKPDVARTFLPWIGDKTRDRGLALERSWEDRLSLQKTTLSDWASNVANKHWPAAIFNATAVESGAPLLFSTSSPGKGTCANLQRPLQRFREFYKGNFDVDMVTAVRLGASFPYVSPAARPAEDVSLPVHLVDGGYSDNYGVGSLVDWLQDGLSDPCLDQPPERVLIIRIRSFADGSDTPDTPARGWFFQAFAPLVGLYNVRDAGQIRTADQLLTAVERHWSQVTESRGQQCAVPKPVAISVVDIVYPEFRAKEDEECNRPPLSWRLNSKQQRCIDRAWDNMRNNDCIKAALNYPARSIPAGCESLPK